MSVMMYALWSHEICMYNFIVLEMAYEKLFVSSGAILQVYGFWTN